MMNIKIFCEQHGIAEELIQPFLDDNIIKQYIFENEIPRENIQHKISDCMCLYTLGLDIESIKNYMKLLLLDEDTTHARVKILRQAREEMLKNMHNDKNVLDCMDHMIKDVKDEI